MDPNQGEDIGWHSHFLLLHVWSDDLGGACLLAQRLEEVAGGCLCPTLPVLYLQLVSSDCQNKCLQNSLLSDCMGGTNVTALSLVRWYSESARWLVLRNRFDDALKNLQRVARINGKPEVIDKLTKEVISLSLLQHLLRGCRAQSCVLLAGFTHSHEKRDWSESFFADCLRPSENQRDETHLHLPHRSMVRWHAVATYITSFFFFFYLQHTMTTQEKKTLFKFPTYVFFYLPVLTPLHLTVISTCLSPPAGSPPVLHTMV